MSRKDQLFRTLRREILAARLKVTLDEQLGRETSETVRALAGMDLPSVVQDSPVVGRVVLSDPAVIRKAVGPIMLVLHEDGSTSWRPIYTSVKGRLFVEKEHAPKDGE